VRLCLVNRTVEHDAQSLSAKPFQPSFCDQRQFPSFIHLHSTKFREHP
jgi:hypothetical protein